MQPERFVTCGLVLRETVTRDADKILTVLTPDRGRLSVIARGARRKGSRVAAACQLLAYSEMTLYEKGRWTMLDAADTIELFDGLRQDLTALSLAAYFAELTEAVSDGSGDVLPLLLNALYALSALKKPPQLVKPAFQFRLMALAGYEPMADGCALCGAPEPENPMLDVVHGVVHCGKCREKGGLSLPLTASGLAALRYVLYGDPRRLYSFSLPPEGLRALNHAADAYVSAQLERSFRTLDYYKTILPQEETKYE
ncbi:MAG TPA: DNA repair protein RecO [Oscillibacter sp.]|jgi:DNA repair protein RecO (recombination protein O)|nr:DNA repair protein RecO [Oscillibacter sp.]